MSALEDRLRRFAYEWHEAMNSPYAVNMMPLLLEAASDVRSLAAPSLEAENHKLRELATYALKHIIEFECEVPDREMLRGKPCEDCADYGSSDCPKCMPRMFDVSGIEVDE